MAVAVVIEPAGGAAGWGPTGHDGSGGTAALVEREQSRHLGRGTPRAVVLNDEERRRMTGGVVVLSRSDAVAGRRAGDRVDLTERAYTAEPGHSRCLKRLAPLGVLLGNDERPAVTEVIGVRAGDGAVAGGGAGHRRDESELACIEVKDARDLPRRAPAAVRLGHDERLHLRQAGVIQPAGRTVPGRRAGNRSDPGEPAYVEGAQAGHLARGSPLAVFLRDHESLEIG